MPTTVARIGLLALVAAGILTFGSCSSTSAPHPTPTPVSVTNTFSPNDTTISTSEGAPYGFCDFWTGGPTGCGRKTSFGYGPTTIVQVYICLSGEVTDNQCSQQPAVTGPLPASMLQDMDTRLAAYQGTGMRLLLRFTYNFGPIGPGSMDAPIDVIAQHIDQLAPIVLKHSDLIFALEAGFIGTWGEWHDSTHGNDSASAHKVVLDKELSYFGGVFPILVRTPGALIQYEGGSLTPPAGFGLHDDFYASNATDANTWNPCAKPLGYCFPSFTTPQLQAYGAAVSSTTMFAGEYGQVYAPLQTCAALATYSYTYHAQSITLASNNPVITELENEGCALSIYNRMGTRIELEKTTITGTPAPNSQLTLAVTLANTGFGRVIRPRPATLLFVHNGGEVITQIPIPLSSLDLRQLASGPTPTPETFQFTVALPSTFPTSGAVAAVLLIPDPAPSLTSQAAYALPLNSVDANHTPVFDPTTGFNSIAIFNAN